MVTDAETKHLRAIVRLLGRMISKGDEEAFVEVMSWAYEVDRNTRKAVEAKPDNTDRLDKDATYLQKLYPTKDKVNNGRSTNKGIKTKQKLMSLMKSGKETRQSLEKKINDYLAECKESGAWLKDFGTFLNNLPIPDVEEPIILLDQDNY